MNWTKPNFTQWVAIVTTVITFGGYIWHSENDRIDGKIKQHDQEQRLDSIATAFAVFVIRFDALQKDRSMINKQRDADKVKDDERTDEIILEVKELQTRFDDFLFYKYKK